MEDYASVVIFCLLNPLIYTPGIETAQAASTDEQNYRAVFFTYKELAGAKETSNEKRVGLHYRNIFNPNAIGIVENLYEL